MFMKHLENVGGSQRQDHIRSVEMDPNQYQMGRSKLFIKDPASVSPYYYPFFKCPQFDLSCHICLRKVFHIMRVKVSEVSCMVPLKGGLRLAQFSKLARHPPNLGTSLD